MMTNTQIQFTAVVCFIYSGIFITIAAFLKLLQNQLSKSKKQKSTKTWQIQDIPLIPKYPHLVDSMDALQSAPKMIKWVSKLDQTQIEIRSITISDIDWFSAKPDPKKLGFVKVSVDSTDKTTGKKILSNIVFIRGDAVAILIIVKVKSARGRITEHVLLCEQMRLPTGGRRREICAGMMDSEGNIASVALKEIEEETGFKIQNVNELISLGSMYPSQGGCDEEIHLYSWTTMITEEEFEGKMSCVFGNSIEGEEIKLSFVPMKEFRKTVLTEIKDSKAETAVRRYYDNNY
jgi:8-oxo-dGTP pyrophosphatase MutT (NUDIX family)